MAQQLLNIPGITLVKQGKVRDIYDLGDDLLMVASDRISAFDVILPTPVPGKGRVLTQLSRFWFAKFEHLIPNHLSSRTILEVVKDPGLAAELDQRAQRVKKATPLPIEAIVRGYLSGSGWKEYQKTGTVCGVKLPAGLRESEILPEPIFTPSTKAEVGVHDENITFEQAAKLMDPGVAEKVKQISLRIYSEAAAYARTRGIIIADTKFEFGMLNNELILIDEVLTPDSSRFWPMAEYQPGKGQPSFDKQYVRDWLLKSGWNMTAPGPELPADIVRNTAAKYEEAYKIIAQGK